MPFRFGPYELEFLLKVLGILVGSGFAIYLLILIIKALRKYIRGD